MYMEPFRTQARIETRQWSIISLVYLWEDYDWPSASCHLWPCVLWNSRHLLLAVEWRLELSFDIPLRTLGVIRDAHNTLNGLWWDIQHLMRRHIKSIAIWAEVCIADLLLLCLRAWRGQFPSQHLKEISLSGHMSDSNHFIPCGVTFGQGLQLSAARLTLLLWTVKILSHKFSWNYDLFHSYLP